MPGARVYLFGSYARGEATAASDVDVLVVIEESDYARADEVRALLRRRFLGYPLEVHVVTREQYERWYARFVDTLVEV